MPWPVPACADQSAFLFAAGARLALARRFFSARIMKNMFSTLCGALACALLLQAMPAAGADFIDPLAQAAVASPLASHALINGLALAGKRLVGAGQRGHIVYSDDQGVSWTQARVPVSTDLVALQFPTPLQGWAVGHDGVVLHTDDGGTSWRVQLDGHVIAALLLRTYDHDGVDAVLRADARRLAAQGADQSLLDVWFDNARSGFVVGAFNLIFHTDDGGASWQPWLDRSANPKAYHLNAIRSVGGATYVVGEQGLLVKLAAGAGRFEALKTPYEGSFFGIVGEAGSLMAYGLRGNAWRSTDGGLSWAKVDTSLQVGLTAGTVFGDGRYALVSQGGQVLLSDDHGASFHPMPRAAPGPVSAVAAVDGALVLGGLRGLRRQPVSQSQSQSQSQ